MSLYGYGEFQARRNPAVLAMVEGTEDQFSRAAEIAASDPDAATRGKPMHVSVHNVTRVELVDRAHGENAWIVLRIHSADYEGEHVEEITCFPKGGQPLRVEQDDLEPERDEIEPVGRYEESASYRNDMIGAGRGHLLGE